MTAAHSIGIYVVIDETMRALGHTSHPLAGVSDAEVLTVAVGAAAFCGTHHARARARLHATGYLARAFSSSRFSRRIPALADGLVLLLDVVGDLFAHGQAAICAVVIDSRPIPVCTRARAALPHGARARVLRLLRRQGRDILRRALAPGLHDGRLARGLHPAARRPARPHAPP